MGDSILASISVDKELIVQDAQNGSLGIAFDVMWYEPMSNSTDDIDATQRAQDFQFGW